MTVIARLPRLDASPRFRPVEGADRPACPEPVVAAAAEAIATDASSAEPVRVAEARPASPTAGPGNGRQPRPRFPTVSTLFLAFAAGICWVAVWWQERERMTEARGEAAMAGQVAAEEVAARVDGTETEAGSVTR